MATATITRIRACAGFIRVFDVHQESCLRFPVIRNYGRKVGRSFIKKDFRVSSGLSKEEELEKLAVEREVRIFQSSSQEIQIQESSTSCREENEASFQHGNDLFKVDVTTQKTDSTRMVGNNSLSDEITLHEENETLPPGIPKYTFLEKKDKTLNVLMAMVKSRNNREKKGKIVLEGRRLIRDAIEAGLIPETVFFSKVKNIQDIPLTEATTLYKVPYKGLKLWSDLVTSPGIIGIFKAPQLDQLLPSSVLLPITVICDNVREPGNLGAILRCAAGVGCQKVILTKGCVDLWEPKVLRAGSGAHFRIPVYKNISWQFVENYLDNNTMVFLADNNTTIATSVSDEASNRAERKLLEIEMTKDELPAYEIESTEDGLIMKKNEDFEDEERLNLYKALPIPSIVYHDVNFSDFQSLTLVVGGETEGLSGAAVKLAYDAKGTKVTIPLLNSVESLNTGTALGIILFEMRRQFLQERESLQRIADESRCTVPKLS